MTTPIIAFRHKKVPPKTGHLYKLIVYHNFKSAAYYNMYKRCTLLHPARKTQRLSITETDNQNGNTIAHRLVGNKSFPLHCQSFYGR